MPSVVFHPRTIFVSSLAHVCTRAKTFFRTHTNTNSGTQTKHKKPMPKDKSCAVEQKTTKKSHQDTRSRHPLWLMKTNIGREWGMGMGNSTNNGADNIMHSGFADGPLVQSENNRSREEVESGIEGQEREGEGGKQEEALMQNPFSQQSPLPKNIYTITAHQWSQLSNPQCCQWICAYTCCTDVTQEQSTHLSNPACI